ncbi:MAG: flagellar hook-associated protein FlgL [Oligoflexia bacterium]|nr:flagellar hook-associated protein FlgL [Oligoflexia bacterium]
MSRVADTSSKGAVDFALNKAKGRLEELHLKGAGIKRVIRPSDDPAGNIELMQLRTRDNNFKHYIKNANVAMTFSELTEESLSELSEILVKAKEIAVAQASSLYNGAVRRSVAEEVDQLGKQILGIANRHIGNRYLFSGYKNEIRPFSSEGTYYGDSGVVYVEISKDFYIPVNIPGDEIFYQSEVLKDFDYDPLGERFVENEVEGGGRNFTEQVSSNNNNEEDQLQLQLQVQGQSQGQGQGQGRGVQRESLFAQIRTLINALRSNDNVVVQDLLERLDNSIDRIITLRTRIGSNINTIRSTVETLDNSQISVSARKSAIEDADVAELFTDITKQDQVLKAVYKTGAQLLNQNLLDFLR